MKLKFLPFTLGTELWGTKWATGDLSNTDLYENFADGSEFIFAEFGEHRLVVADWSVYSEGGEPSIWVVLDENDSSLRPSDHGPEKPFWMLPVKFGGAKEATAWAESVDWTMEFIEGYFNDEANGCEAMKKLPLGFLPL